MRHTSSASERRVSSEPLPGLPATTGYVPGPITLGSEDAGSDGDALETSSTNSGEPAEQHD